MLWLSFGGFVTGTCVELEFFPLIRASRSRKPFAVYDGLGGAYRLEMGSFRGGLGRRGACFWSAKKDLQPASLVQYSSSGGEV